MRIQVAVEGGLLMRVFAVAQIHQFHKTTVDLTGETGVADDGILAVVEFQAGQVVADRAIVAGYIVERGHRQFEAGGPGQATLLLDLRRDSRVTTVKSGCFLCWPRNVQSSILVAKESWGLLSSACRANRPQ